MGLSHLDDVVLNEYLDGTLPPERINGVEEHLAICPACTTRLAEMQQLFTVLLSLPDKPAPHNLVPAVLDRLDMARPTAPSDSFSTPWAALFIAEALAGIACLAWVWSFLDVQVPTITWQPSIKVFESSLNFLQTLHIEWLVFQQSLGQLYLTAAGLYRQVPAVDLPERWLVILIPIGAALWVAGNALLLRSRPNQIHGGDNEQQ
jgi:predicted anti-sigma-YlaC factor YlaD